MISAFSPAHAADPWPYFPPLPEGTVKVYEGLDGAMKVEERVDRMAREKTGIRFVTSAKVNYIKMHEVTNVTEYLFRNDGRIYKTMSRSSFSKGGDHRYDPPLLVMSFPLTKGKTWKYEDGTTRVAYEVLGFRKVEVPAGKFEAVILKKTTVIDLTTRPETQVEEEYYAPEVGFIGNRLFQDDEWTWAKQLKTIQKKTTEGRNRERNH
ncbi:MAG: hypothetical protein HY760_09495 [Nitrospirae bacterium]|nr:hypothetical protein [Nitrospirota bacterium]